MRRLRDRSGMTLVEMMFALVITGFICAGLWAASVSVERLRVTDEAQIRINDQARLTMETILWGYKPKNDPNGVRDGIREAASFTILNGGTQLNFTDRNGVVRKFRQNGLDIEYDEPGLNPSWQDIYTPTTDAGVTASTALKFSNSAVSADVVVTELVIGRRIENRWYYASLKSSINIRN